MEMIGIKRLSFFYPEQIKPAIDDFSLSVGSGEFLVICGPSGCGKSTLLRQMKTALTPHGNRTGEILFGGVPLDTLGQAEQSAKIGFVMQSPENQIVTDKVWHELAFGLESLGFDTPSIRRRVAEMASYFGIQDWFHKNVSELSGGQKQILNLASVMVMQPEVLILDEPTSQLDPIAASDFISALGKINRELGTTVILTEHRLDEAFSTATRVVVMENGKLLCGGTPSEVGEKLRGGGNPMFIAMPAPMRVWAAVGWGECPATVRDGREWLGGFTASHKLKPLPEDKPPVCGESVIEASEVWFRYGRELPDVVKDMSLEVKKGEFYALLGGNGAGKTTTLRLLAGLEKPNRGEVRIAGKIALLPQNPQTLFVGKTVREDLLEILPDGLDGSEEKLMRTVKLCRLEGLLGRHPYDLSGGEQQRAALAKVLLTEPEILLTDEPTKGLDAEFKREFANIIASLLRRGITVLAVSHDVEFCACFANRCALFFDGSVVTEGTPREFFSSNNYYTTAANRMSRGICGAVTPEELMYVCGADCGADIPDELRKIALTDSASDIAAGFHEKAAPSNDKTKPLPLWRKITAVLSALVVLAVFAAAVGVTDLSAVVGVNGTTTLASQQLIMYGIFIVSIIALALSIGRRSAPPLKSRTTEEKRRLGMRTKVAAAMILLLIPLTLFTGTIFFGNRKYYLIALLLLLECMLPFFLVFEGRKPKARELVIIAVLCAIGVAGRAVFFMLPQFKPVMALTIIAGVSFGAETGFFVGAMTMLASNVMFSQGPWTPWQMFAMGIIGFIAGVLYKKGLLRRGRGSLCVFGAISAVLVYGGLMNFSSALMWSATLNPNIILTYYITGFPMDCVHAAATAIFLWFAALPMLEKLDRIKVKYGLIE